MWPRHLALCCLLLTSAASAQAETVGVTAAVNQDARSVVAGSGPRTIELGDNVVFNQRIDTDANGLVQILLADGTAFTVGPNSSLTIDSFVYDPAANTASVAASVTKGFVRFIGGRTSKDGGGVSIDTPIGTAGIRGAVADINLGTDGGLPPFISLLFGEEISLSTPGAAPQSITEAGFSIAIIDGQPQVQRTPPEYIAAMQQALAPKPGSTGGAPNGPTNQTVQRSGLAASNSAYAPQANALSLNGYVGIRGDFDAAVAWAELQDIYRDLRDFFNQHPGYQNPDADPEAPTFMFAPVRVLTASTYLDPNGNVAFDGRGIVNVRSGDEGAIYYGFNNADGVIQFEDGRILTLPFLDDQPFASYPVSGAYPGTLYVGQNEFRAYFLKDSGGSPVYAITGYSAAADAVFQNADIWRYRLSADPLAPFLDNNQAVIPFADGARAAEFASYDKSSGDLYIAGTPGAGGQVLARGLQAWIAISGQGANQASAIGITIGSVRDDQGPHFTGSRTGSERLANGQQLALFGSVGTQPSGENNGGFFGASGENIVIGTNDAQDGGAADPYGTIHVGNRTEVISGANAARTFDDLTGFVSGIASEVGAGGPKAMRGVINLRFDAANGTLTGKIDANPSDVIGGSTEWTFFNIADDSAYVSDDLFAARQSGTGSYLVSAGALFDGSSAALPSAKICECEYLKWGWWGEAGMNESAISGTHLGNWIIGDVTDAASLPQSGTATFSGNAIGTVLAGGQQYIAAGDMSAGVDFGTGQGNVAITNFDGHDFGSGFSSTGPSFSGATGNTAVSGAFVGPGASEIMGNFSTSDGGWSATGIFGGAR